MARVGYYGADHVERLRLIGEMQDDGFNLGAIKRRAAPALPLRDRHTRRGRGARGHLRRRAHRALRGMDQGNREKAVALGVLLPLGDDKYEVPSPAMLRAAEEAVSRGVTIGAALTVVERLRSNSDAMARAFVRLFLDELWKPVRDSDERDERWPEVVEALERLRPVASETVVSVFRQSLSAEMQSAFERELERQAKRSASAEAHATPMSTGTIEPPAAR